MFPLILLIMSIFGCNPAKGASLEPRNVDLSEYARKDYVDQKVNYRVLKSGDTMSGNLNMRRRLVRGLPTDYPPRYAGDEAVSWGQALGLMNEYFLLAIRLDGVSTMRGPLQMGNHYIKDVKDPLQPQDAATKNYVDRRKPLITVWAEKIRKQEDAQPTYSDWSFGAGLHWTNGFLGYTMLAPGRILSMGLTALKPTGRGYDEEEGVIIMVNGIEKESYKVPAFSIGNSNVVTFDVPLELAKGDILALKTTKASPPAVVQGVVSLLIELDM